MCLFFHIIHKGKVTGGNDQKLSDAFEEGPDTFAEQSLILSAMKRRDPKTNLELGRNLLVDLNVIDLM